MHEKFLKPYDASATESRIYAAWEKSGLFNPDECVKQGVTLANAPPYSIVLPPPNVTGRLHMGHALMLAVQDILIRYKRMRGFHTLWVPGTDHAAIATQSVVEKKIKKEEDKSRHDLGREELLKRIETDAVEEIILATNTSLEGEATSLYLIKLLKSHSLKLTRLAHGIPMGGDLEYIDAVTIGNAIQNRVSV